MAVAEIARAASGKAEARGAIQWSVAVDLKRCTGCQSCTIACKLENGTPPGVFWTRVLEKEEGTFPFAYKIFIPQRCNHCAEPPCVEVCPTGASHVREQDNLVLVDQDACIGCHACVVACPYQARFIPGQQQGLLRRTNALRERQLRQVAGGHGAEVHALRSPHRQGSEAGLRGDLPHQGVDVRRSQRPEQRNFEAARRAAPFSAARRAGDRSLRLLFDLAELGRPWCRTPSIRN